MVSRWLMLQLLMNDWVPDKALGCCKGDWAGCERNMWNRWTGHI